MNPTYYLIFTDISSKIIYESMNFPIYYLSASCFEVYNRRPFVPIKWNYCITNSLLFLIQRPEIKKNLLMPKHSFTNSAFTHSSAQPLLSTKHKDARCNCATHTHPYKCTTSIYNCNVYLWHDQNTQFFFAIKRFSRFNQKQLRLKKNFIKSENINILFTFIFWQ